MLSTSGARVSRLLLKIVSAKTRKQPPLPPAPTQPIDHSFWWAQTQPVLGEGFSENFPDDSLHFFGHVQEVGQNEEMRRYRLFGRLPGRNKLKAGSRLLVSPFPEIKFICLVAGCCEACGQPPTCGQGGGNA